MSSQPLLQLDNIHKSFYGAEVLHGVNLDLCPGEVLGLVGENGAGKSTLMSILGGVYGFDSGTMRLGGEVYTPATPNDATRAGIAFIRQEFSLFSNLTVAENLFVDRFPRRGLSVDNKKMEERAQVYIDLFRLDISPRTRVESLPMGVRQIVEISKALEKDAKIIIFDEPTNGLDPSGIVEMRAFLQGLNRDKGITIVISSHHLAELEQMATTYAFLKRGCVVEQVSARTLQERCADYVDIAVSDAARFTALLEKELRHERYLVLLDGTVRIFDPAAGIEAYSGLAVRAGMDVSKLERRKMSLEQYYLELKEKGVA